MTEKFAITDFDREIWAAELEARQRQARPGNMSVQSVPEEGSTRFTGPLLTAAGHGQHVKFPEALRRATCSPSHTSRPGGLNQ